MRYGVDKYIDVDVMINALVENLEKAKHHFII
jgi:hypothetical protein